MKLRYKTVKYLNYNSYSRKNIGYLFAIEHGAKEIYEIDEDIIIPDLILIFSLDNHLYGQEDLKLMILEKIITINFLF